MNLTPVEFLAFFEEFKKVPLPTINLYITVATGRVPVSVWGTSVQYATALMVAHMLTTQGRKGDGAAGGSVTQESVGDLSRSYASMFDVSRGDALLLTTRYGIDFVQLRKETIVTGMTTYGGTFPKVPFC